MRVLSTEEKSRMVLAEVKGRRRNPLVARFCAMQVGECLRIDSGDIDLKRASPAPYVQRARKYSGHDLKLMQEVGVRVWVVERVG